MAALAWLDPATFPTVTCVVPEPGGVMARTSVEETRSTARAGLLPKRTERSPTSSVPKIVTTVPPLVGPMAGVILLMIGAARKLKLAAGSAGVEPAMLVTVTGSFPDPGGVVTVSSVGEST